MPTFTDSLRIFDPTDQAGVAGFPWLCSATSCLLVAAAGVMFGMPMVTMTGLTGSGSSMLLVSIILAMVLMMFSKMNGSGSGSIV